MFDREALRARYARMSDADFMTFATHEVAALTPVALEVLREEMQRRRCFPDPEAVIEGQTRQYSSEEFQRLIEVFRHLPCPTCGRTTMLLSAVRVSRGGDREDVAGCPLCLAERLRQPHGKGSDLTALTAMAVTFLPARAVLENDHALAELQKGAETQVLREYVWRNRGEYYPLIRRPD